MSDTHFSAAAIHADQKLVAAFEAKDKLNHEEAVEYKQALARVWPGQDHYGGTIFRIPEQRIEALKKRVAKIEKRAEKLNIDAPTVTDTREREEQEISKTKVYTWAYVAINGVAPKIAGWTFIATLQHEEEGNVIRRVPNPALTGAAREFEKEDGLAKYRDVESKCDHCEKKRQRKDTYVVVNEDGRSMQVGTNCLADFLGGASPQAVAKGMEYMWTVLDEARGYETGGFSGISVDPRVDTAHYLTHVAWSIRKHGWTSKGKAYEYNKQATADVASSNMFDQERQNRDRTGLPMWEDPSDEDAKMAEATLKWVREEFDGDSDYASNLVTSLASDRMNYRSEGIAASGVAVYQREMNQKAEWEQEKATSLNEHFGNEKDRVELTLTVKSIRENYQNGGYNDEGVTYIHKLKDAEGRTFTWFGSYSLTEGETYTGKWTIKGHGEWKSLKDTKINRPHGLTK